MRATCHLHGPVLTQMKMQLISVEDLVTTPPILRMTAVLSQLTFGETSHNEATQRELSGLMLHAVLKRLFMFIYTSFNSVRGVLCISYILVPTVHHLPASSACIRSNCRSTTSAAPSEPCFCLILLKGWQLFHPECSGLNRLCRPIAPRFFHVNLFRLFLWTSVR